MTLTACHLMPPRDDFSVTAKAAGVGLGHYGNNQFSSLILMRLNRADEGHVVFISTALDYRIPDSSRRVWNPSDALITLPRIP